MQGKHHQYNRTAELAKKYSHSTYLASPVNPQTSDELEQQMVLIAYNSSLFSLPHEREALLQKAQRVQKLQHPHLLPILDMGLEDDQPFVVRDYLPSASLRNRLKEVAPQRLA